MLKTKSKTQPRNLREKAHPSTPLYAGIDLHSNNLFLAIVQSDGRRITCQKLPCDLPRILDHLAPYKERLQGLAVESTFNWYWLVDGLREHGFPVSLANPAAIQQYDGIKHADDRNDAWFLAELLRLQILPCGYIYDPQRRPIRDLLRRRAGLVRQRTALILSIKNLHHRARGRALSLGELKAMEEGALQELFHHPAERMIAGLQYRHVHALTESILAIEKETLKGAVQSGYHLPLKTIPGIGPILGMTIALETGDIARFKTAEDFASYCRTVQSTRITNGKKKGDNNQKCGNKYLAWAFVEAANFARRYDERCRQWYDRKLAKRGKVIATKALACKLAKAAWHIMRSGQAYEAARIFPSASSKMS
jgi:transposase